MRRVRRKKGEKRLNFNQKKTRLIRGVLVLDVVGMRQWLGMSGCNSGLFFKLGYSRVRARSQLDVNVYPYENQDVTHKLRTIVRIQ